MTSERGDLYLNQLRDIFSHIEDDCIHGRIDTADVMHITSPWSQIRKLENSIISTFLGSLHPRRVG